MILTRGRATTAKSLRMLVTNFSARNANNRITCIMCVSSARLMCIHATQHCKWIECHFNKLSCPNHFMNAYVYRIRLLCTQIFGWYTHPYSRISYLSCIAHKLWYMAARWTFVVSRANHTPIRHPARMCQRSAIFGTSLCSNGEIPTSAFGILSVFDKISQVLLNRHGQVVEQPRANSVCSCLSMSWFDSASYRCLAGAYNVVFCNDNVSECFRSSTT